MATAASSVRERPMSASLKSRRFELSLPPLTFIEQRVLDICIADAKAGRQLRPNDEIAAEIGATGAGTVPGILLRIEQKGYISREIYQRGRRVCIEATGHCTLPPACTVPHWRTITDRAPLPAIQQVRERDQSLASWIETTARSLGRDYLDFATELLRRGAQDYRADQESGTC
jgi:hypothetical protein